MSALGHKQTLEQASEMSANTAVLEIVEDAKGASVTVRALPTGQTRVDAYDCVILCTGLDDETVLDSPIIGPQLRGRISKNEAPDGYAIAWDGPNDRMIFIQSQNKK